MLFDVLLWDIDGTLLDFGGSERAAIRKCFSLFSLGECSEEMLSRYSEINRKYWRKLENGELTKAQVLTNRFVEFFAGENIVFDRVDELNAEYQRLLGETVFFNENSYDLIQKLRGCVRQYAVTNGTALAQERKLEKSGLGRLFDGVFISDKVGAEKPDPAFFDFVFSQIGPVSRNRVLIIGDSLSSDIRGGNNAKIRCGWYNPSGGENPSGLRVDYVLKSLWQIEPILAGEEEAAE